MLHDTTLQYKHQKIYLNKKQTAIKDDCDNKSQYF